MQIMMKRYRFQILLFLGTTFLAGCQEPQPPVLLHSLSGAIPADSSMAHVAEMPFSSDTELPGGWVAAGAEVFYREVIGTPEFYLDDIGRIARTMTADGKWNLEIYFNSCRTDTFKLGKNIVIPKIIPRDFAMYDSAKVASASIMGLGGSIKKNESMKYESKTIISSSVSNDDLDFSKIPAWASCETDTCSYWIVKDVSLREVFYRKYSSRDKKIEVRELPYIGNALSASGKFWTSAVNETEVAKYFVIYRLMKFRKPTT